MQPEDSMTKDSDSGAMKPDNAFCETSSEITSGKERGVAVALAEA